MWGKNKLQYSTVYWLCYSSEFIPQGKHINVFPFKNVFLFFSHNLFVNLYKITKCI